MKPINTNYNIYLLVNLKIYLKISTVHPRLIKYEYSNFKIWNLEITIIKKNVKN